MTDFRRFRDAWLQVCQERNQDGSCPPTVVLNGSATNLKRDLNHDGCIYRVQAGVTDPDACATRRTWSRFDFNGDGRISLEHLAFVPVAADGAVVATRADGTMMNDLDVLKSQFDADPNNTELWRAIDLDSLMVSGDLEIHADDFFPAGATNVTVEVLNPATSTVQRPRTIRSGDGYIVMTVPVSALPFTTFQVQASALVGGDTIKSQIEIVQLHPGEDIRLDLSPEKPLTITYVWRQTVRGLFIDKNTYDSCSHYFDWYCTEVGTNVDFGAAGLAAPVLNRHRSVVQLPNGAQLTEDADSNIDVQLGYRLVEAVRLRRPGLLLHSADRSRSSRRQQPGPRARARPRRGLRGRYWRAGNPSAVPERAGWRLTRGASWALRGNWNHRKVNSRSVAEKGYRPQIQPQHQRPDIRPALSLSGASRAGRQ